MVIEHEEGEADGFELVVDDGLLRKVIIGKVVVLVEEVPYVHATKRVHL